MKFCAQCGVYRSAAVRLDALFVEEMPPATYWRGYPLNLLPSQTRMLLELLKAPIASVDALAAAFSSPATDETLRVMIHRLRRDVPPEIKILSVYGQGYRIRVNGHEIETS